MHPYLEPLEQELIANSNAAEASAMATYMKNRFEFYGIKRTPLRNLFKAHYQNYGLPEAGELHSIIEGCWTAPQREWHYFGMEVPEKFIKKVVGPPFADRLEWMIVRNSWWDSVDHIATKLVGPLVKRFPELKTSHIEDWSNSNNIWLQRTAILYQRDYKTQTDTEELAANILKVIDSDEFFLQKVIGWMLRQYSKTDPHWVLNFVAQHESRLAPLSKKEALRLLE